MTKIFDRRIGTNENYANMKSAAYLSRNFIADAVEKAAPAVVNITIDYGHLQGMSSGSGFIIEPQGLIVTNAHVVARAGPNASIKVTLANGVSYAGRVHSVDMLTDLALVELEGRVKYLCCINCISSLASSLSLPTMRIGSSSSLRAGEWVVALGSPLFLQNSVSAGIVSAVARHGSEIGLANRRNHTEYIQTDAAINSGNSGGPLVNLDGEVIGINAMKVAGDVSNISFAIPIDTAVEVITQLRKQKTVTRPYVGMQMVQFGGGVLPEIEKLYPDLKQCVVVKSVTPGSPAALGGLLPGDVIVEFAGTKVESMKDVTTALGYNVGQKMCMKVRRDGNREPNIFCFITQAANRRQSFQSPTSFW
ncbi:serine protease family S01B [Thraustotheca clavata]|uniref:Serine protease family S01B n=1 Tax=Thraustotheca clavata TaxID=74557 RepID=A0A1V9ZD29_9STRA|nr:serine protease family S01B [Thraustotheca clavata]